MAGNLELTAADGHTLQAYRADAEGTPKGGVVIIQEIFGVNSHIRSVADIYAGDGYTALAPALFDRVGPDIQLGYDSGDVSQGRELRGKVADSDSLHDIQAAIDALKRDGLEVAVIGYCWGGSLAWLTATKLGGVAAAVSYYGGQVPDSATDQPKAPVLFHFGETDASIPMDRVELVSAAHPGLPLHIYPAGHGFSCDARGSYDAASAGLAKKRTLGFLEATF